MSKENVRKIDTRKGGQTNTAIARRLVTSMSGKATFNEMRDKFMEESKQNNKYLARRYIMSCIEQVEKEGTQVTVLSESQAAERDSE